MKAAAGTTVSLYWDSREMAEVGDYIRTVTTGRTYEVIGTRVQIRGRHVGRQHLRCIVMAADFEPAEDDVVHPIAWYRRDRQR